jgi:hypothetical protein
MSTIPVQIDNIGSNYTKVLDTEFKTFVLPQENNISQISVDDFFEYYEELFYQIPKEGDSNSHNYILNRTLEYLSLKLSDEDNINGLLEEINRLRRELLQNK